MFLIRPRTPAKPFALPPTLVPAPLVRRAVAAAIDLLPWGFASVLIFVGVPQEMPRLQDYLSPQRSTVPAEAWALVAWWGAYLLYAVLMEWRLGTTVGKRLLRLRVVADEGRRLALREAMLRNLTKVIELQWPLIVLLLLPVFNRFRQRLGDMIARTTVVDALPAPTMPRPPEPREPLDDRGPYQQDPRDTDASQTDSPHTDPPQADPRDMDASQTEPQDDPRDSEPKPTNPPQEPGRDAND